MLVTIITDIIIIIIMFSFSFFVFKSSIKRINDKTKKYFLEKLQQYNYLIDEREEKLESIEKAIEQHNEQIEKIAQIEKLEDQQNENIFSSDIEKKLEEMKQYKLRMEKEKSKSIVYDIPTPEYKETNFFDTYKKLRKKFKIDANKILKEFIKKNENEKETEKYEELKKFRKQFTDKSIYECLTLTNEEQYEIVKEVMSKKIEKIIEFDEKFKEPQKFVVTKLIDELDEKIKLFNPNIYVYVGQEDVNYDDLDERIKTKFYKNMLEGIIIYYKGKIYDYSI
mgnify:CR=1 FL=1